jgi:hypothetical protein
MFVSAPQAAGGRWPAAATLSRFGPRHHGQSPAEALAGGSVSQPAFGSTSGSLSFCASPASAPITHNTITSLFLTADAPPFCTAQD